MQWPARDGAGALSRAGHAPFCRGRMVASRRELQRLATIRPHPIQGRIPPATADNQAGRSIPASGN